MSIALAAEVRNMRQEVDALISLVRVLSAEVDALKSEIDRLQAPPRRGRPPRDVNEQR